MSPLKGQRVLKIRRANTAGMRSSQQASQAQPRNRSSLQLSLGPSAPDAPRFERQRNGSAQSLAERVACSKGLGRSGLAQNILYSTLCSIIGWLILVEPQRAMRTISTVLVEVKKTFVWL